MRALGQLLMWIALAGGVLSAATAYLVPTETLAAAPGEHLPLTLAAGAGKRTGAEGEPEPRFPAGEVLTAEKLAELQQDGVQWLRVREFSFARWPGKWYFLLSLVGLLAGGLLNRAGSRTADSSPAQLGAGAAEGPSQALEAIHQKIEQLCRRVQAGGDEEDHLLMLVDQLGELQSTHMEAFVEARPKLISKLGLGGFAKLMDAYAAAERQINRAWSAAADRSYDEAVQCLRQAAVLTEQTRQVLAGLQ